MRRGFTLFVSLSLLVAFFNVSFASAGPVEEINGFVNGFVNVIDPIAQYIFGGSLGGEDLFSKILFFSIILGIVWASLSRIEFFNQHNWVSVVIAVSVSLLSTRFIDNSEVIEGLLLPFSALGVALTVGLPFVIYFIVLDVNFSNKKYKILRYVAWSFLAVAFVVLYFSRWTDLDAFSRSLYLIGAVAAVVMLFLDGAINRFWYSFKLNEAESQNKQELISDLQKKRNDLDGLRAQGIITSDAELKRRKKKYADEIKSIMDS